MERLRTSGCHTQSSSAVAPPPLHCTALWPGRFFTRASGAAEADAAVGAISPQSPPGAQVGEISVRPPAAPLQHADAALGMEYM